MPKTPLQQFQQDFAGKKVLLLGLGLQGKGVGVAKFLHESGAKIRITDLKTRHQLQPSLSRLKNLPFLSTLGKHDQKDIAWADIVIKNPAVMPNSPFLLQAKKMGKKIFMDTALFCRYAKINTIGITGTRGKSTTAKLSYDLLVQAGYDVFLGGNLPGSATLPLLKKIKSDSWAVIEFSSWDLQGLKTFRWSPHIAVLTNFYPDHLNYYPSLSAYWRDKKIIFQYQGPRDYLLLNKDQPVFRRIGKIKSNKVWFSRRSVRSIASTLPGQHNRENIAAVHALARLLKIRQQDFVRTCRNFVALPYRMQKIASVRKIDFINDSTSTTPVATMAALNSYSGPVWLILGGNNKSLPDDKMIVLAGRKTKGIFLINGSYTATIAQKLKASGYSHKIIGIYDDFEPIVKDAMRLAAKGDIVLFSPGYTSFGLFINEFDRGDKFNRAVKKYAI